MLLGMYRQRSFEYEEVELKNEALGPENDNGRKSGPVLADTNRSPRSPAQPGTCGCRTDAILEPHS